MKIWLVTGDLIDPSSGAFPVVNESALELIKQGHQVKVIGTGSEFGCFNKFYHMHRRSILPSIHFSFDVKPWLDSIKNEDLPDFVEFHGVWLANAWIIASFCVKKNIPYSIVSHGGLNNHALSISNKKKKIARFLFADKFLKQSSFIQALNESEVISIEQFFNKNFNEKPNILKVGNGVKVSNITSVGGHYLYLGRLHKIKNIETLIQAFVKFSNGREMLIIAGTGDNEYVQSLHDLVSDLNASTFISFFGFANQNDKVELYGNAKAFVLPSFSEGQPVAALEALSFGVPLIVSDKCNMDEVNNIVFLSTTSEDSLINTFHKFDRVYNIQFHEKSKRYCVDNYSWVNVIQQKLKYIFNTIKEK